MCVFRCVDACMSVYYEIATANFGDGDQPDLKLKSGHGLFHRSVEIQEFETPLS